EAWLAEAFRLFHPRLLDPSPFSPLPPVKTTPVSALATGLPAAFPQTPLPRTRNVADENSVENQRHDRPDADCFRRLPARAPSRFLRRRRDAAGNPPDPRLLAHGYSRRDYQHPGTFPR